MLERLGYRVTARRYLSKLWRCSGRQPDAFDLVITDQTMPGNNRSRAARRVLKVRPDIPIILCTGYSETVDAETAREAGITTFVMKPFTIREMAACIRQAVEKDA